MEEQRDSASLILNLVDRYGPNYRVLELISERFPALTIDGTIDCLDWDLFRIKVFCHGGKVAFSNNVAPEDFDNYLSGLFGSEIATAIAEKWREEKWHGPAPEAIVKRAPPLRHSLAAARPKRIVMRDAA